MNETLDIELSCPEDWVPLSLDPQQDLVAWSEEQARELALRYEAEGERADVRRLARDLRKWAADSRSRQPLRAFALYLSGVDYNVAVLEVGLIQPDEEVPEITLTWIAEHFSGRDFATPEVVEAKVEAGMAVRIRQDTTGPKKSWFGARPVIHSLVYGIRPAGFASAVMLYFSWTHGELEEPLRLMADNIAQSVRVTPAEG